MATTDTVMPSAASADASSAKPASSPAEVNPSVNKMTCLRAALLSRSALAAASSEPEGFVPPSGLSAARPWLTTSWAGSF